MPDDGRDRVNRRHSAVLDLRNAVEGLRGVSISPDDLEAKTANTVQWLADVLEFGKQYEKSNQMGLGIMVDLMMDLGMGPRG